MIISKSIRKRKFTSLLLSGLIMTGCLLTTGCDKEKSRLPKVKISIWADERYYTMIQEELNEFKNIHSGEAEFEFSVSREGEGTCKDTILMNPDRAPDIFSFADDQFEDLYKNNILMEITENVREITDAAGGTESGAATASMRNGKLYAYPVTAGNGYFLYYNTDYISENDTETMDGLLEAARRNGKKISMDFSSGWYIYSFFKGAGLEIYADNDGTSNFCNWNSDTALPYKGVDVARSMLKIADDTGFVSLDDAGFVKAVQNGTVIAGINGAWNSDIIEKEWGDSLAACKLPTYTIAGNQEQMCSFTGYKLMGINSKTQYPEYCMELAEYLTNEKNQIKRFEQTGECPSNLNAASDEKVQSSPAVAALAEQSVYGFTQNIADPFWEASGIFGITIASGNPYKKDLQDLLDETQQGISQKKTD